MTARKRGSAAPSSIRWHLKFRVANRRAFDKCVARVLPLLGPGSHLAEEGNRMGWTGPTT